MAKNSRLGFFRLESRAGTSKNGQRAEPDIRLVCTSVVLGLRKIGRGCRWIFQKVDVDKFFTTLCKVKNIKNAFFGQKVDVDAEWVSNVGVDPPP